MRRDKKVNLNFCQDREGHQFCVVAKEIISSKDQAANLFAKALLPAPFSKLLTKLGMVDLHQIST